jgi:hypothetical protein
MYFCIKFFDEALYCYHFFKFPNYQYSPLEIFTNYFDIYCLYILVAFYCLIKFRVSSDQNIDFFLFFSQKTSNS